MKRSTIVSIAKQLNISTATVSRALNNKGNVKESTRERVLEAAREFNYIPNQLARSLQNAKTNTIAVVIPDITEDFFGNITAQIDHVVSRDKFMLLVCDTHENATLEKKYLDMLHERRVDAIVLATVDLTGNTSRRIRESGIPIVYIDNIPSCEEIKSITIDNQLASHIAVDYLFEKGHRKIAGIFGSQEETTGCERYRGYIGALSEHDLSKDLNLIEFGDYKYASGYRCMKNLLSNEKMTAVYVTSEKMTYGAIKAIQEAELRIPEDISVIGFDVHKGENPVVLPITSIRQPEMEIGTEVGDLLLKIMGGYTIDDSGRIMLTPFIEAGRTVRSM